MDNIGKWVNEAIEEEHEIEALVRKEVERLEDTLLVEGAGLPSLVKEFVNRAGREFPEFIWQWHKKALGKSVILNLLISDRKGLPHEDYLSACGRIVAEVDTNTRDIPKLRINEFTVFAASYGISVTFQKVAELPREVIRRVQKQIFSNKPTD